MAKGNNYLWKTDGHLNRVAEVREAHSKELESIEGVTGVGLGKDHIIIYVSTDEARVPPQVDGVPVVKVRRD